MKRAFALHYAGITFGSFTFEVIGGSLGTLSSRRRSNPPKRPRSWAAAFAKIREQFTQSLLGVYSPRRVASSGRPLQQRLAETNTKLVRETREQK